MFLLRVLWASVILHYAPSPLLIFIKIFSKKIEKKIRFFKISFFSLSKKFKLQNLQINMFILGIYFFSLKF